MRLTIVNYSFRRIGGIEQNLDVVLPELERRGHTVQFVYFHDEPESRARIRTSAHTRRVDVALIGEGRALDQINDFNPDLINVHGEVDPAFQERLIEIAPSAYSVHNYYGTCISGLKTNTFPIIQPCNRVLGPACLLHYFPRGCGGRNPITMVRRYNRERERLAVISRYDAVITHSRHMESEYKRHGLNSERIHGLPYEVVTGGAEVSNDVHRMPLDHGTDQTAQLLFVGRMEKLKGGQVLIAALPQVQRALQRPIELHLAGEGPQREDWQKLADAVMADHPSVSIRFHGWAAGACLQDLFRRSHLVVVPSLWPEPFGKVGPEAATYGLPAAAFAVGGIEEWLLPGVNGMLAPGNPPKAAGLADAIANCLRDPEIYERLCQGALASIQRFDLYTHVDALLDLFERVCHQRTGSPVEAAIQ